MMLESTRLLLLLGPTMPEPAPSTIVDSLVSLEVRNNDSGRDGFQMTFSLGRESLVDYNLLLSDILEPPSRVVIAVVIGVLPQVLVDGIITHHQVAQSNKPGEGTLVVTGEDISLKLDLDERKEAYADQADSDIVRTILGRYATYGLQPDVTPTDDQPQESQRIPMQRGTDLAYVQELARRNGFVFYVEPTSIPGITTAHWGPPNLQGSPQPALTMNMGASTNLESISFTFDALGPATPRVSILEPSSRVIITVPVPTGTRPPLSRRQAESLRTTLPTDTANLEPAQAALQGLAAAAAAVDAVTGSGQMDAVRYGRVLRARQLVGVRGVGDTYDGSYYVKQVTHRIKRGEYKQSFSLSREGRGTLTRMVTP
jgi:hypothetical protein